MRKLLEGMRGGDLEDLVLPLVSVDEFQSKIDHEATVIAFYVNEHGAAEDLNRFIQRSPVEILDSEISPAPDQNGYFLVFVELLANTQFSANVGSLLDEIAPLANISGWKMQVRGQDDLIPFDCEELTDLIKALNKDADPVKESIRAFLTPSILTDMQVIGDRLVLEGANGKHHFSVVAFGPCDTILSESGLDKLPMALSFGDVSKANRIAAMLGENWTVSTFGDHGVLHRSDSDDALVIR